MLKTTITFLTVFISVMCYCQPQQFIGGIFFNANGIHIETENDLFWQKSNGNIWGGGGLSAGINVKRFVYKNVYLSLEFRYIRKGSVYEYVNQYSAVSGKMLKLNYLETPFSAGYMFKTNRNDYYLETGIAYGKLFSSKVNINDFVIHSSNPDIDYFKNYDISWFGCFKFALNKKGKRNILFGLRYSHSVVTIHEYYKLTNLVYGLQLDYIFRN